MSIKDPAALSQEKKARILDVAKARFMHYGVNKTTMREIADDLGMAVSNLYLYFENKREIVLAIAEACRAEQEQTVQQVMADRSLTPGQKLECLLLNKFRVVREFRGSSARAPELIAYLIQEFPERSVMWREALEGSLRAVLEEGVRLGVFGVDPRQSARMLAIATAQFFLPPHIELPLPPTEEELIALIRWHLAMFEAPQRPVPHD